MQIKSKTHRHSWEVSHIQLLRLKNFETVSICQKKKKLATTSYFAYTAVFFIFHHWTKKKPPRQWGVVNLNTNEIIIINQCRMYDILDVFVTLQLAHCETELASVRFTSPNQNRKTKTSYSATLASRQQLPLVALFA